MKSTSIGWLIIVWCEQGKTYYVFNLVMWSHSCHVSDYNRYVYLSSYCIYEQYWFYNPSHSIGLYRDVWIATIASSRKSLTTQTAAICVRFHGRRVRHLYVTMQITFLARKSALIYRRGLRQRVASLTIDCNGVFAIRAYSRLAKPISPIVNPEIFTSAWFFDWYAFT